MIITLEHIKKLNILPFTKLVDHRLGVLIFKIHFGYLPKCITSLF